ncbi:hypothetical protein D3C72_2096680 [compost metagenome]
MNVKSFEVYGVVLGCKAGKRTWEPMRPISRVYPSGAAFLTAADPIAPFAPALLTTTTGCPRTPCAAADRLRAAMSASPPTLNGTMSWMGFAG